MLENIIDEKQEGSLPLSSRLSPTHCTDAKGAGHGEDMRRDTGITIPRTLYTTFICLKLQPAPSKYFLLHVSCTLMDCGSGHHPMLGHKATDSSQGETEWRGSTYEKDEEKNTVYIDVQEKYTHSFNMKTWKAMTHE